MENNIKNHLVNFNSKNTDKTNYKLDFWALYLTYSQAEDYNDIILYKDLLLKFCQDKFQNAEVGKYIIEHTTDFNIMFFIMKLIEIYNLCIEIDEDKSACNLQSQPLVDAQASEVMNLILYKIEFAWYDTLEEKIQSAIRQILNLYGVKYHLY